MFKKRRNIKLDEYEQEIEDNIEKAPKLSAQALKREKRLAEEAARNHIRKAKQQRINIRIFTKDLERVKEIAEDEGLPYQTFLTSIIHKFISGKLKEIHV
jgi:predicted DNA binding CopG/RHH family protein